jgi:hypothetical protein
MMTTEAKGTWALDCVYLTEVPSSKKSKSLKSLLGK